ncbi:Na+/H+ antiporter subunit E [Ectothiorhodospira lacustris]|uniref:Na+/H+ antiporter subunit E n=1 Tax=Ectothiorhodospira lacustris TaxID=2899127 RepID=UPI001EE81CEA|nr:Na+/H+ antiporter subunit E [Ectothiorhodospira lacustris]MCG5500221.1 Na+/H+ antiporter subunit E [Ectothiorhodospira lacustris]MCG5509555.1 Na+/H+ antiporter subunit E [Ectothiorhodospira lacustris]MCG5521650.1 Na+/H+ antiporter subunit E [Ectothiorhodospira lacustris]
MSVRCQPSAPPPWRRFLVTLSACLALWWILTDGDPGGWVIGVPVALLAAASVFTLPPGRRYRLSLRGLVVFMGFFLWQSFVGGLDVSRRALSPRMPLAPGFIDYPVRLPPGPALTFFMNVIGLLPGTLSVGLHQRRIQLHVLDVGMPLHPSLRRLENRVAALFSLQLEAS